MTARPFSRWQASGLRLAISAALAVAWLALLQGLWFPGPLFGAAGGQGLFYLLLGVDLVLGPLLTLIVFRSGKSGMKFDLVVLGAVQFAALAYALSVVSLARPAFVVFVLDRFELVTAVDLKPDELQAARYEEFRSVPWSGPRLAAADLPTDPAERQHLVELSAAGIDVQHFPRYYVPYAERTKQALARAVTIARLRESDPVTAKAVDAWLGSSGTKEGDVRALLLRTRFAWIAVLVDPQNAQPVKYLLGERIE